MSAPEASLQDPVPASEITYKIAWQKNNEKISKDACALWMESGAMKQPEAGIARAKLLCVVAYDGDKLVAVSTITVGVQQQVYAKVCHFMCIVRPEYRRRHIATELAMRCLVVTEGWSKANPTYKILAFVIQVQTQDLVMKCYKPVWNNKINFIGYSQEGAPLYLRWFRHAYFGEEPDGDFTFYPSRPGAIGKI